MPISPHISRCHHVRLSGVRCGSPSMRGHNLCYFHLKVSAKPQPRPQEVPSLEDGNAIQLGIAHVIRRVLMYDLDYKAASALLYAYKLAILNLKNVRPDPYYKDVICEGQEELAAAGAFDPAKIAEYESIAAAIVADKAQKAAQGEDVGNKNHGNKNGCATPLSPAVGDRVGTNGVAKLPPRNSGKGEREAEDFLVEARALLKDLTG